MVRWIFVLLMLAGCRSDLNAGKFPTNGRETIDGMRPAIFGPQVLP